MVRRSIAPRLRHIFDCARRFQEEGVYVPIDDPGNDDITILAHALDSGFASIAAHERSRERFLSVVAHELKTPITSIQGFLEVAQRIAVDDRRLQRPLEIAHRNARRLNHLIEDILLSARAQTRDLSFHPRPLDLAQLTSRIVTEVQTAVPTHPFEMKSPLHVSVLADDELLSHAVWSLLTSAAHVSVTQGAIDVAVKDIPARPQLEIRLERPAIPPADLELAMTPFGIIGYEDTGFRSSVGFSLCREIARLHGGELRTKLDGPAAVLTLELPA
jgi:signal transduction histidine kinase